VDVRLARCACYAHAHAHAHVTYTVACGDLRCSQHARPPFAVDMRTIASARDVIVGSSSVRAGSVLEEAFGVVTSGVRSLSRVQRVMCCCVSAVFTLSLALSVVCVS
jgi:hypothetical protein